MIESIVFGSIGATVFIVVKGIIEGPKKRVKDVRKALVYVMFVEEVEEDGETKDMIKARVYPVQWQGPIDDAWYEAMQMRLREHEEAEDLPRILHVVELGE